VVKERITKNVAKGKITKYVAKGKITKNVAIKCPVSVFKNTIFLISRCGIYISH
jgi:hypothetical protein